MACRPTAIARRYSGQSRKSFVPAFVRRPSSFVAAALVASASPPTHPSPAFAHNAYYVVSDAPKTGWAIYLAEGENENEFLIQDAGDLVDLATNCNKSADFATAGVTFKQTVDIPLSGTFPGIGLKSAKDNIAKEAFTNYTFQGTYDGQGNAIKGLVLQAGEANDYGGLFNGCFHATIKNLKVGIGGTNGWSDGTTADSVGAVIAGVTADTTIESVETIVDGNNDTFWATKTAAGIVGYAAGGTVLSNCVNRLNIISGANEKCGGLVACAQNSGSLGTELVIDSCSNYGNVESKASGKRHASLLVSYADYKVVFKGNCHAEGTVTQVGGTTVQSVISVWNGSVQVSDGAVITVPADYKTVSTNPTGEKSKDDKTPVWKDLTGLWFATVAGDPAVATLVKTPAKDGTQYKVMAPGATIELAAGESIKLDTNLATATVTTQVAGYQVKQEADQGDAKVITYSLEAINYTITYTYADDKGEELTGVSNSNPTSFTIETDTITIDGAKITKEGYEFVSAIPNSIAKGTTENQTIAIVMKKAGGWNPDADPTVPATNVPGLPESLKGVSLKQLSTWAVAKSVDFADASKIIPEAFLLNCANTQEAVDAAEEEFKFTEFDPANPPTADAFASKGYNGTVQVKSFSDAACTTEASTGDQLFYRAFLVPTPAPVK